FCSPFPFSFILRPPPIPTLFPYTTLFRSVELELFQLDRWPLSAGVLEDDFLRQLSPPRIRKPAATTCPSRTGPGCGEGRVGFRRSSPAPVGRGDPPPCGGCRRGPPCGHRYRCR